MSARHLLSCIFFTRQPLQCLIFCYNSRVRFENSKLNMYASSFAFYVLYFCLCFMVYVCLNRMRVRA